MGKLHRKKGGEVGMSERIAINYAKEIYRKRIAVEKTKSDTLKRDYWKNIKKSRKELKYYCKMTGLNYAEIIDKAVKLNGK